MIAVDTNIVVRLLAEDDPVQSPIARDLVYQNDVWVGVTVLLETEWILRSARGVSPADVCVAFRSLAGLPRVQIEQPTALEKALTLHEAGVDFADALHAVLASHCEAIATFDRTFALRGERLGLPVRRL